MADSNHVKVNVRMYCHGLGDCFLLKFTQGEKKFNMLIDCGVLKGTEAATEKIKCVAANIAEETEKNINLVIATHQHWDHISGFEQAQDSFNQIDFEEVWLGWTEDPDNETAKNLRNAFKGNLRGMHNALKKMNGLVENEDYEQIKDLLEGFNGENFGDFDDDDSADLGAASKKAKKKSDQMKAWDYILNKSEPRKPKYKYCYPGGEPLKLNGIEGVRVYVFGPPTDPEKIRGLNPPSTEKYRHPFNLNTVSLEDSFFVAVNDDADFFERNSASPFDAEDEEVIDFAKSQDESTKHSEFFKEFYHSNTQNKNKWRRIDKDWLSLTSEFALKMDSYTNNTSLVLAIELIESGKVLLFVGDAQAGNWQSWHDYTWKITGKDGGEKEVKAENLLNRTVLYKVGHHASHNATLKKSGLEMMTDKENLIAIIPVDSKLALSKKPHKWEMPFDELLKDLQTKTNGRVVASDRLRLTEHLDTSADADWADFKVDKEKLLIYKDENGDECKERLYVDFEIS